MALHVYGYLHVFVGVVCSKLRELNAVFNYNFQVDTRQSKCHNKSFSRAVFSKCWWWISLSNNYHWHTSLSQQRHGTFVFLLPMPTRLSTEMWGKLVNISINIAAERSRGETKKTEAIYRGIQPIDACSLARVPREFPSLQPFGDRKFSFGKRFKFRFSLFPIVETANNKGNESFIYCCTR